MNTSAPRNQPRGSKPSTPGPVATSRSRSSGFKPAVLAGGFKRRMLNKRETTAVDSASAAIARREPRSCQIADINNSAIQTALDVANHLVTGWVRMTLKPHPIMMIATAKFTRLSQRAESLILIATVPLPYFDWRRSEEHTSELQSHLNLVCRLLLEKKKNKHYITLADDPRF